MDFIENGAIVGDDDSGWVRTDDLRKNMLALALGMTLVPDDLGRAQHLDAIGVDQIKVADQVGRRDIIAIDGDWSVEGATNPSELQPFAISLEQLRDDQLADFHCSKSKCAEAASGATVSCS